MTADPHGAVAALDITGNVVAAQNRPSCFPASIDNAHERQRYAARYRVPGKAMPPTAASARRTCLSAAPEALRSKDRNAYH